MYTSIAALIVFLVWFAGSAFGQELFTLEERIKLYQLWRQQSNNWLCQEVGKTLPHSEWAWENAYSPGTLPNMRDAFLCCAGAKDFQYGEGCFDIRIDPKAQMISIGDYIEVAFGGDFSNENFIPYQFPGNDTKQLKKLELGKDIKYDEEITTDEKTILHILLPDGAGEFYLNRNTKTTCSASASPISCGMLTGKLRAIIKTLGEKKYKKKFEIHTPTGIFGVRGTEFVVDANVRSAELASQVWVFEGTVDVSDLERKNAVQVNAGEEATVGPDGVISTPQKFDPASIERWWEVGGEAAEAAPSTQYNQYLLPILGVLAIVSVAWFLRTLLKSRKGSEG